MTAPRGKRRLPFRYCEPAFFGGLLDDPLLFLRIRPLRTALLFDCGQIAHLAKRVIKPVQAVFITHAHMDHIMGIPTLVRHHHAAPRPLDVYGPSGIAERITHLLAGFDWNLREPTWFTLRVHEILPGRIQHFRFPGPEGFARFSDGDEPRQSREIWACPYLTVEAEILDHKLPVLAFRVNERPYFSLDGNKLSELGLVAGNWVRDLKSRIWKGQRNREVLVTRLNEEQLVRETVADPEKLYTAIQGKSDAASLGYVTDIGWTPANREIMQDFLNGLTLLCSECTFLALDEAKARASHHLTTTDLNCLVERLAPRYVLAMHLSKSYLRRTADFYSELRASAGTDILRLPNHIVPAPVGVEEVSKWLRPK